MKTVDILNREIKNGDIILVSDSSDGIMRPALAEYVWSYGEIKYRFILDKSRLRIAQNINDLQEPLVLGGRKTCRSSNLRVMVLRPKNKRK